LNHLLDQALDLAPDQRSRWMDSLPPEYEALRATLRELLFRQAGMETSELLRRVPAFPIEQLVPVRVGDLIGPYRLIREIGSGGMATVWLAERADGSLQRRVALKLPRIYGLDGDLAARLDRERDILASLEHPGIARLYDAGVDTNGRPYLALEYVDGLPLDLHAARHALSVRQRLALFEQVARAVAYAHARLIVHRDLKPTNVLVRASGEVLLLDFGIAGLLQPDPNHQRSVSAFTPSYAAPEQFAGESPTVATDVYSLGVMLFELLARRSPYVTPNEFVCPPSMPLLDAVDRRTARELGQDLAAIVAKALQPQPQDRYASVGELLDDQARLQRHQPVRARPDTSLYRARKFVRRFRTAVALGSALLLAIVVGAAMSMYQAALAMKERDRAVQMLEQSTATNEFWNTVLTEAVANDESISMQELLKRSEQIAQNAAESSPLQAAIAIDSIAALYLSYGLPGKAEALLSRTLEQYQGIQQGEHVMFRLRCAYALAIGQLGRTEEADALFSQVLRSIGNEPSVKQYCLQSRAAVANDNFDVSDGLKYTQEAHRLQRLSPVRSPWQSAQLESEIAYAYALNGKNDEAQQHYESARTLFESIGRGESHAAMAAFNGWGILEIGMGDPAASVDRFNRAFDIARKRLPDGLPPPDLIFNYATALSALGQYDDAIHQFEGMRARTLADGNAGMAAAAVAGIADATLRKGDLEGARQHLDGITAVERATLVPDSAPLLRVAVVEARLLAKQQNYEAADRILTQALGGFERKGAIIRRRVLALIFHAELLLAMGRIDAASFEAQRALEMAELSHGKKMHSDLVGLARRAQGHIQLAQGDGTNAARSLRAAIEDLKATLGADHPDTRAAEQLIQYPVAAVSRVEASSRVH
jgi:serine/threonine-protein kinase